MSVTATIRRASASDARAIARVHVDCWRSAYAGIIPDRVMVDMSVDDKASFWRGMVLRAGSREAVLVASVAEAGSRSGEIVGFASCGPADRRSSGSGPGGSGPGGNGPAGFDGEVHTLYVLSDWQEQGLGRALLCSGFRALKRAGFGSAFVWVLAQNPARFFYEAMGGHRIGERAESLWGVELPEIAYGWPDLEAALAGCTEK
jgi:ribosomal protein S18 acetylase RimI-like enzyme